MASDVAPKAPIGSLAKPPKREAKPKKPIKQRGKVANEWERTKLQWFKENPPDYRNTWPCGICGQPVSKGELDMDHLVRKGSHPEMRADIRNLRPVHRSCHIEKDSGMRYYKHN